MRGALFGVLLLATPAVAQEDARAQRLAELRAEISDLHESIADEREAVRSQLRRVETESLELEARIRQSELRLENAKTEMASLRETLAVEAESSEALTPVLHAALDNVEASIKGGLPYRIAERVGAVDELRRHLNDGTLQPTRVAGRLWQLVEDELRLTRENAIDRQVAPVDGQEELVDVARVGTVGMYFKTADEQYGIVQPKDNGWAWTSLSEEDALPVVALFDALSKQVRVGYHDLPAVSIEVN